MLLDVEVSVWIQATDRQQVGKKDAYGIRNQFCNQRYYVYARIAETKELVDASPEENKDLGLVSLSFIIVGTCQVLVPASIDVDSDVEDIISGDTHNAEKPSSEGIDGHCWVICLGDNSANCWEGTRISIPVAFNIILTDDARQVYLQLDEMAVDNFRPCIIVGVMGFLPGYGLESLRQRLFAFAAGLLRVHGCCVGARERQVVSWRWLSLAWGNGIQVRLGGRKRAPRLDRYCIILFISIKGGFHSQPVSAVLIGEQVCLAPASLVGLAV